MTSLYAISDGKLRPTVLCALSNEKLIEAWVEADPSLLGIDAMIIGRQVPTDTVNSSTFWRWMPRAG